MGTIARRLVQLVVVVVLSTLFAFACSASSPATPPTRCSRSGPRRRRQQFREDNGLDKPFFEQYATWLGNLVQGDLGKDYQSNTPGRRQAADRVAGVAPADALRADPRALVAIPLGVFTAYRAGTKSDRSHQRGAFALLALPSFVLALALAYWVGVKWKPDMPFLGQIPVSGYEPGWLEPLFGAADAATSAKHFATMLLPAIALAAGLIAVYMRLLRSDMIATLQENFITMARSKGLSDRRILWRHALRPSSLTLLTVAGLNFGTLIGGAVAVEVIFEIPGIGTLIYQAINARQFVELQSYIAIIAIGYVLINFVIDALYVVLDPRIRRAHA